MSRSMTLSEIQRLAKERGCGEVASIEYTATVMHMGWESDNYVYLVKMKGGGMKLMTTNPRGICFTTEGSLDNAIENTEESLNSLKEIKRLYGR